MKAIEVDLRGQYEYDAEKTAKGRDISILSVEMINPTTTTTKVFISRSKCPNNGILK